MSVLAQFLEASGIMTTVVSLIRLHSEKVAPPRSLWVPFELGRPLGAPGDKTTQADIVSRALSLLTTATPPGVIEDYVSATPAPAPWTEPTISAASLVDEVAELMPRYNAAQKALGRTTVGVARLSITEIVALIQRVASGDFGEPEEATDLPFTLQLRYAIDDLKAFYTEAGAAGDLQPTSDELGEWFWQRTQGGQTLLALREKAMASDRKGLQTLGSDFTVPRLWLNRLGM